MKVMTVCRMNQARSAFAEAVLGMHFPEVELCSAGVTARKDARYLPGVVSIARRWGITMRDGFSREISKNLDLFDSDLVICAEEGMKPFVIEQGYEGRIVAFEEIVPDPSFMPQDPEMFNGRNLETALAKVAWINVNYLRKSLNIEPKYSIDVVIPEREENVDSAISWALAENHKNGGVIVDADLRAPLARELRKRDLTVGKIASGENLPFDVLSNLSEDESPERRLISPDWTAYISELAATRPVTMITAPQITDLGPLPDSFLASIPASSVKIVRV